MRDSKARYYSGVGQPSINPEFVIRMLLISDLQGSRSERRLVEGSIGTWPVAGSAAWGTTAGCRSQSVPRVMFEDVVRRCAAAGMVPGENAVVTVDPSWQTPVLVAD